MPRTQSILDALSLMQRRHPLALFLAFGAALFGHDALRGGVALEAPPGAEASAARWLEDEVLYREALARGLDQNDLIVRRRMVQKMHLLLETAADVAEPDEAELQAFIDTHAGRYGGVAQMTLEHRFLSRSRHGERLAEAGEDARRVLLEGSTTPSDPHPAGTRLDEASEQDLRRLFGPMLATRMLDMEPGEWQGPIASVLGLHFVRVDARVLRKPDMAAVRERARRDYLLAQRDAKTQIALSALKAQYGLAP